MLKVLAFDLGASSGRGILGTWDNGTFSYEVIHRFENTPYEKDGKLHWDFSSLLKEIHKGMELAGEFDSVAFDTWGVDFGLLDESGNLIEDPVHYRDHRTDHILESAAKKMELSELYSRTGNQIMPINTLFQLMCSDLKKAKHLLFMPDLLTHALCGASVCEYTIASTSQMLNPVSLTWEKNVLDTFDIPPSLFAPFVKSGTVVGTVQGRNVISVAGHDTQCAGIAVPSETTDGAFLSCGTWSLLGCQLSSPMLSQESMELGFSNEIGADGSVQYLKNIIGLWILQESRRQWKREGLTISFGELESLAAASEETESYFDPDDPILVPPGDLPGRLTAYFTETQQNTPNSPGSWTRCIYENLALKYRHTFADLKRITGKTFPVLHILGGGAQSAMLCQYTANALGIPVTAGPVEATALGNMMIQLVTAGVLKDFSEGRKLICQTENIKTYYPTDTEQWDKKYENWKKAIGIK